MKKKTCPDSTGSRTYFFDSEGHMISGWVEYEGDTYFCGTENEGWAYTGWQYLEPDDDLSSDDYDDQEWFNFKSSGKARTSTTWYSKGKYYNFNSDGVMNSDWYDLTIATVATDADGNSVIGTSNTTISKGAYTTEDGTKGTGWVYAEDQAEDDTHWYYLVSFKDSKGTVRNVPFNSVSADGLKRAKVIKGKTYLFDTDGVMLDDLQVLGYDTPADTLGGAISKKLEAGTYYFNKNDGAVNGQMVTGKTTVTKDGEDLYYYFDKSTGKAITNIVKDGSVYGPNGQRIAAEDGNSNAVVTLEEDVVYNGHKILKDSTVVVSSTGKLRTSGTVKVDGVKYEISSNTKADAKWDAVEKPE